MIKATIGEQHYLTTVYAGNHVLTADEPLLNGGGDRGVAPQELLAASLASCTCITLRMYSERKKWNAGIIEVNVDVEKETNGVRFNRKILLTGILNEEQKAKLLDIANHCPVHKILSGVISINTYI